MEHRRTKAIVIGTMAILLVFVANILRLSGTNHSPIVQKAPVSASEVVPDTGNFMTVKDQWTRMQNLPSPPDQLVVYKLTDQPNNIILFTYDGTDHTGDIVVSPSDPDYPNITDLKLTSFVRSQFELVPPLDANVGTLLVSSSGDFAKDNQRVWHLDCEGLGCVYDPVLTAQPASFQILWPEDPPTAPYNMSVAKDTSHVFVCNTAECHIKEDTTASSFTETDLTQLLKCSAELPGLTNEGC